MGNNIGKVRHKHEVYDGVHEAILEQDLFNRVQAVLGQQAPRGSGTRSGEGLHLLNGLVFDETGDRLSPTHATNGKRRFRYYISSRLATKRKHPGDSTAWRIAAKELERSVEIELQQLLLDQRFLTDQLAERLEETPNPDAAERLLRKAAEVADTFADSSLAMRKAIIRIVFARIEIGAGLLRYTINGPALLSHLMEAGTNGDDRNAVGRPGTADPITIERPFRLRRRGVEARIVLECGDDGTRTPDQALINLIVRAQRYLADLTDKPGATIASVAASRSIPVSEVSRILPLAFLAPSITLSILDGKEPVDMTVDRMARIPDLPLDWQEQADILTA